MNIINPALRVAISSVLGAGVVEVTYRRGGVTKTICATPGRTAFEQADDDGLIVRAEVRDWLIERSALESGGFDPPEKGDQIVEVQINPDKPWKKTTYTYEVNPLGGTQHYREFGPTHQAYRIHTKRVDTVTT